MAVGDETKDSLKNLSATLSREDIRAKMIDSGVDPVAMLAQVRLMCLEAEANAAFEMALYEAMK